MALYGLVMVEWSLGMKNIWFRGCTMKSGIWAQVHPHPFLFLAWLCLLVSSAQGEGVRPDATLEIQDTEQGPIARLLVEIADTPATRERGLMERVLSDDETGMLFIFPVAATRSFWMRNTPASLDMLFADAEGRIIHIAPETRPFSDQHYPSHGPAMYVLETRGGFATRHGVVTGMRLNYVADPLRRPPETGEHIPKR